MHYLSSVYFVSQLLHVSGVFVAHHPEVYYICVCVYIYNNWYVLWCVDDCLLANPANRQSTKKHNTYQLLFVCVCVCVCVCVYIYIYTAYLLMIGYKYARNI